MPLAVQKLQAADLPAEILLDDSSAMMPGLSLSAFQQVQVVARLSATGSAAPSPEDQEARSPPLALEPGESRLSLTIPCCKAQE